MPGEKLVLKLWETVAEKGIGSLFKPWQMRREGRATIELKREELLMIAQAERDAERIRRGEAKLALTGPMTQVVDNEQCEDKSGHRCIAQLPAIANDVQIADTIRKEINFTRALLHAEEALEQESQSPPEEKIDEDWLFRWRDSASQVSNEELQNLWGRVLAGEVKAPGSYSLRTLEFLKNLTQHEAEAIAKLSRFAIGDVIFRSAQDILDKSGVTFDFLLQMQQLGVVVGVEAIGLTVTWNSVDGSRFISPMFSNSMVLITTADNPAHTISMQVFKLTRIGVEVMRLGKFEPDMEYLRKVGEHLKGQGVKVQLARYVNAGPNQIRYFDGEEL